MKKLVVVFGLVCWAVFPGTAFGWPKDKNETGGGHTPVTICHHAGPHPENWHTITVDDDSVTLNAHLGHGDTLGACPVVEEPPVVVPPVEPPVVPPVVPPVEPPVVETPQEGGNKPEVKKPDSDKPKKEEKQEKVAPPVVNKGGSGPTPDAAPVQTKKQKLPYTEGTLPYTGINGWLLLTFGLVMLTAGRLLYWWMRKPQSK